MQPWLLHDAGGLPCLFAPPHAACAAAAPLLVCVHGFTRRPLEQALAFAGPARAAGMAMLLPLFDEQRHRRYAQLRHPRSGRRSDLALIDTVQDVRRRHGLADGGLLLFGYSAGAQFAHRFAMLHPERVAALAVGAAGWYCWPDETLPYPLGWGGADAAFGRPVDAAAFLRLPLRLWVGERDTGSGEALRRDPRIDALQGTTRCERAERWLQALHDASRRQGADAPTRRLRKIPRAGHDFVQCQRKGALAEQVVDFLQGARQPLAPCLLAA